MLKDTIFRLVNVSSLWKLTKYSSFYDINHKYKQELQEYSK